MEDTIENDNEIVTKYHEECSKGFTPNMPHTNVQLDMSRIRTCVSQLSVTPRDTSHCRNQTFGLLLTSYVIVIISQKRGVKM